MIPLVFQSVTRRHPAILRVALQSVIGFCACATFAFPVDAEEWPQWMGPKRDNVVRDLKVGDQLPATLGKAKWSTPIAGGYAGPAVADGRVFVTDYLTEDDVSVANFERKSSTGTERVWALNEATGEPIWKHEYPVKYTVSYPAGPRCTPVVDGDRVYTLGAEGDLFCFSVSDGIVIWSKKLKEQYDTKAALWGYASHPLIDGDRLICVVGGPGSHLVAFNKTTGDEIWKQGTAPEQGYVPPTIITAGGRRQLIAGRPDAIVAIDPTTGREFWRVDYQASNGSIIMSPLVFDVAGKRYLFIGGYSNKSLLLELSADPTKVDVVWQDLIKAAISPVNVQPLVVGNTVYGIGQSGNLTAVDMPSGDRLWETPQPVSKRPLGSGTAFINRVGESDRYLLFTETGDLVLGKLTREGFKETDRTHLVEPTGVAFGRKVVWSAPAYANGVIYVRNDKEITAFSF